MPLPRSSSALLSLALALCVSSASGPAAAQVAGASSCGPFVGTAPSQAPAATREFQNALGCLLNAERTRRGLPALLRSESLEAAAAGHAAAAAQLRWWTGGADPHVDPRTHSTIASRIAASGYCAGTPSRTGEIAYTGWGSGATPLGAVNWWMNVSTFGHRESILAPHVQELGVGVVAVSADSKAPADAAEMGAYVVNFGGCATRPAPTPADSGIQARPSDAVKRRVFGK